MTKVQGITQKITVLLLIATGAGFQWGCSDSTSGNDEDVINQQASMEILTQLTTQTMMLGFGVIETSVAPGEEAFTKPGRLSTIAEDFSEILPCNEGGVLNIHGSYTDNVNEEGTGTVAFNLNSNPDECGVQTSQGVYIVDGDPGLSTQFSLDLVDWDPAGNFTLAYTGGYLWSGPDGSGSCSVNVSYVFNWTNPEQFTITGDMCGHTFS
jgi:hypothetical protein